MKQHPAIRDAAGRFAAVPRFGTINRYFNDRGFAERIDDERDAKRERAQIEWDADQVKRHAGKDEPGFVDAFRQRVIAYARNHNDAALLKRAGINEGELPCSD